MSEELHAAGGDDPSSPPAVELIGITKRFGAVVACDDVGLALRTGRIHGVVGENGAGKSTLMKVLIGLVIPDAGQVLRHGINIQIKDPIDAAAHGIGMVHQHFSLVEPLTVWENVALGDVGQFDPRRIRDRVAEISEHYGLEIDPDARIGDLSAGMRQRVEIIKCLRRDPEVLVFDEPTSVLSPTEAAFLFERLRIVVEREGKAVALVSHRLAEVMASTDDITVLRDGRVVDAGLTTGADVRSLAKAMVGRDVSLRGDGTRPTRRAATPTGASSVPLMRITDASLRGHDGRVLLDRLSLEVHAGEIVGVAGVEGNGQRPLGDVLSSLLTLDSGTIEVGGREVRSGRAGAMARAGVAVVPEDRHHSGCVLDFTVAENMFIADPGRVARYGLMDHSEMSRRATDLIDRFDINCTGPDAPMWSLSGGNQQRVVMARELSHDPRVLVAAQPTRGLDIGAIEYLSEQIRAAARSGVGVLLISTELDEVLDLADRIVVIANGRIVGELPNVDVDLERLGMLMTGADDEAAPPVAAGDTMSDLGTAATTIDEERPEVAAAARQMSRRGATLEVVGLYAVCILGALTLAALLVAVTGGSWTAVYTAMLDGSIRNPGRIGLTLAVSAPILMVALGTIVSGRAGLVNIGQEGQLVMGSCFAAFAADRLAGPGPYVLVLSMIVGIVGGAIWAGIAGLLRYWRNVPEVLTTLLLGAVAANLMGLALRHQSLLLAPASGRANRNQVAAPLPEDTRIPRISWFGNEFPISVFLAVILAVVLSVVLARTVVGFRLRMLGRNPGTAMRSGVGERRYGLSAMLVSGGFAGLAGGIMLAGGDFGNYQLVANFGAGIGFAGLLAALVARQRVLVAIFVAFVFGCLRTGSGFLRATGVSGRIADVVQGLLVLSLLLPPAILYVRERRRALALTTART